MPSQPPYFSLNPPISTTVGDRMHHVSDSGFKFGQPVELIHCQTNGQFVRPSRGQQFYHIDRFNLTETQKGQITRQKQEFELRNRRPEEVFEPDVAQLATG
jgi:hypothetical protein